MSNRRLTSRDYKSAHHSRFSLIRWREFLLGLALGLLVALVIYIGDRRVPQPEDQPLSPERALGNRASGSIAERATAAANSNRGTDSATPAEDHGLATEPTDFSFYSRLANAEIVVPEKERRAARSATERVTKRGVYWLQVGAYRDIDEAERARAKLQKLDIVAGIQRVAVDDEVWHRVRVGPINNLADVERQRARLSAADFKPVVLQGVSE